MKRQKNITFILIVFAVLACIVYFGVRRHQTTKLKGQSLIGNYIAYRTGPRTITEIKGTCVGGSFDVVRSAGVWKYAYSSNALDTGRVSGMESLLISIPAERELKQVEDLSKYGLENPQLTIELNFNDGSKNTLNIGFYNSMINQYYFCVDDSKTVYTVDPAIYSNFAVTDNTIAKQGASSENVTSEDTK